MSSNLTLMVDLQCHPGFLNDSGSCTCDAGNTNILRCDDDNRYIYLRVNCLFTLEYFLNNITNTVLSFNMFNIKHVTPQFCTYDTFILIPYTGCYTCTCTCS